MLSNLPNITQLGPVAHPIFITTQEAEIRRIVVQSQTGQIVCKTLSQEKPII
jgi:hypothetical protein